MTDADNKDLADLREQASVDSRIEQAGKSGIDTDTESTSADETGPAEGPPDERGDDWKSGDGGELVDALDAALDELEGNDKVVSVWDREFAAALYVLEEQPDIVEASHEDLREVLGEQNDEGDSRSDLIRIFLRAGLEEIAPELNQALREALKRRAVSDL